ncbi:uncharacterized protein LOC107460370 [Arachis duranensis]|uniref:Uncharacterized protein LOC107460370 n=1 Tax=Arachis duranensis TaxID=130453 RepID=A0A6P4BRK9_ARADU|nr:uncharacterized protein LOC107460370 [Arachis duranensis]
MDSVIVIRGAVLLVVITCSIAGGSEGRSILVGGSQGWRAGTNYTEWTIQNSPFHINDTLVFKYPAPNKVTAAQSVYVLPTMWSYTTCEFRGAKLLGNTHEGGGEGFKVKLDQWRPYYFASPENGAGDCIAGLTKFIAIPTPYSSHQRTPFSP